MDNKIDSESEDLVLSPEFEQCLKNIEDIEKGMLETTKELKINIEKRASPFEDFTEENSETESSDEMEPALQDETHESSQLEQAESFEAWGEFTPPKNEELFKNPKLLRTKLKEASLALKMKQEDYQGAQDVQLASESCDIISKLKSKHERKNITYASLYKLFSDPYFKAKGHVDLQPTKSGVAISAKSFVTMQACSAEEAIMTTGTHHNHSKTYKGYNPEFLKNVVKILDMFGV
ncbi:MAG: hypothetical protein K2W92_09220 [Alphaproteobacteria bacterium]|nr:hypothetical protein [Alphaproteobacteria bacterium]